MKSLALFLILALHSTGLWTHLSTENRAHITTAATGRTTADSPAQSASPTPGPIRPLPIRTATTQPGLDAAAAVAIDRATGTVLYAKNTGAHRPIASVTKMITALVILSRHRPDESVTIPKLPQYPVEAETMGLVPGDTFTIGTLLQAALVPSANDAADALAIIDAGSISKFATRMNLKMDEWGISDAHFASASGLQDDGNYASAAALAKIGTLLITSPTLAQYVKYTTISITSGQGRLYNLKTTNELLASSGFYGIKTGYTLAAGECFVGLTRINGHEVVTVVLGASNRFGATTTLTNWIGRSWQWL